MAFDFLPVNRTRVKVLWPALEQHCAEQNPTVPLRATSRCDQPLRRFLPEIVSPPSLLAELAARGAIEVWRKPERFGECQIARASEAEWRARIFTADGLLYHSDRPRHPIGYDVEIQVTPDPAKLGPGDLEGLSDQDAQLAILKAVYALEPHQRTLAEFLTAAERRFDNRFGARPALRFNVITSRWRRAFTEFNRTYRPEEHRAGTAQSVRKPRRAR